MKRIRIDINVANIDQSTRFYEAIFGKAPTSASIDRVRWSFDDPKVEFTISERRVTSSPPH